MRRPRSLSTYDRRAVDAALAMAALVAVELNVWLSHAREGPLAANLLLYLPVGLALLWRRTQPPVTLTVVLAAGVAGSAWLSGPAELPAAVAIIVIASYSVGAHADHGKALAGLALGVLGIVAIDAIVGNDTPSDFALPPVLFCTVWFAGRVVRSQAQLTRALTEKAERAERERELEQTRAVAEERRRLAREIHDVLAHDLSVMVIQASGARRVVERDPEGALDAVQLVARVGRHALAELRQLFGTVHRGAGESLDDTPTLSRVDRLVQHTRDAGLPVELRVEGEPHALPRGVDLAAYRVLQEALTNVLRHARATHATVGVRYAPTEVRLEVSDDGTGPTGNAGSGGGHGLVGMRERVSLYGGELRVGRRHGGGFTVRARLPLEAADVASSAREAGALPWV